MQLLSGNDDSVRGNGFDYPHNKHFDDDRSIAPRNNSNVPRLDVGFNTLLNWVEEAAWLYAPAGIGCLRTECVHWLQHAAGEVSSNHPTHCINGHGQRPSWFTATDYNDPESHGAVDT